MLFYWFIFIVLAVSAIQGGKNNYHFSFALLLLLGATRAKTVGNDLNGDYWLEYVMMGTDSNTWGLIMHQFEFGFLWIMAKYKQYIDFNDNPLDFFHILFAFTFVFYYIYIRNVTSRPALAIFFMYAFSYYFSLYNAMRQEFCVSIILLCILWCLYSEKKRYLLLSFFIIIFSLLFHKSMMFMLLVIPVYHYYKRIPNMYLYLALIISSIFSFTLAEFAINQMSQYAFLFDDGTSNIANYMRDQNSFGSYSNISNVLNTLFCIYCVYCSRQNKDFFLSLYVLGIVLLNILTPINWVFQRLAFVFMFFRIFVYAYLWDNIQNKEERYVFRFAVIMLSIVMFQNRLNADNYQDVVPYVNEYIKLE